MSRNLRVKMSFHFDREKLACEKKNYEACSIFTEKEFMALFYFSINKKFGDIEPLLLNEDYYSIVRFVFDNRGLKLAGKHGI